MAGLLCSLLVILVIHFVTRRGVFVIAGEVVDDNGKPLDGVTLELEKSNFKNMFTGSVYTYESVNVNGTFKFIIANYAGVRLTIRKPGYYSEYGHLALGFPSDVRSEHSCDKGRTLGPLYVDTNIRIHMEKAGNFTHLLDYSGGLEYHATGEGIVVDFDKRHGHGEGSLVQVKNIDDASRLPSHCAYIIADKDADGKIAAVGKAWGNFPETELLPKRLTLVMSDPRAGFIKFSPDPNKKLCYQMYEGPDYGYQQTVVIEADDFHTNPSGGWLAPFYYFKTHDRYGKGGIFGAKVNSDRSAVRVGASFSIQPDGGRYLRTDPGDIRSDDFGM